MAKKLIVYGTIIFIEEGGQPVSATVQQLTHVMLLEEDYIADAEVRMGKKGEDWLVPHLYKGKIIWQ